MAHPNMLNGVECMNISRGTPYPFWSKDFKVTDEPLTLLTWQIAALSLFPHLLHFFLKHLGQPLFVSQVLASSTDKTTSRASFVLARLAGHKYHPFFFPRMGGIIFGPSILGAPAISFAQTQNTTMHPTLLQKISLQVMNTMFVKKSHEVLDTLALFGSMFFMFKLGVMSDPTLIKRAGMKAIAIGFCCYAVSLVAGLQIGDVIKSQSNQLNKEWAEKHDPTRKTVILSSMTSYPVIACALTDMNIINSDIGHLATSSAMVIEIFNFVAQLGFLTIRLLHKGNDDKAFYVIALTIGFLCFIYFMVRPAMLWVVRRIPEGGPVKDIYIFSVFVLVLVCGFMSEYVGQSAMMSVFLLGLAVPDGPPLGAAVVSKLEYLVRNLLMPLHLALLGLKINVNDITYIWLRGELILFFTCFLGKFVGIIFPALFFGVPVLDMLLLGLIMNIKGIIELGILNLWCDAKSIDTKASAALVFIMLLTTAIITPLAKYLYDPTNRYLAYKKRSIISSKNNPEFRLLVCIHEQEDIPPILKLLQISISTKGKNLCVYLLHLIELIGRSSPLLQAHPRKKTTASRTTKTERIVNTFLNFEEYYQTLVSIQPFSATSPYSSMHSDIVDMAADKKTFLIIFPYQKKQNNIDGTTRITKKNYSLIIANLLKQAPCSVGIFVNRNGNLSITSKLAPSVCHVVLFFLGGADDREALEYALTIADHPSLILTVVRFISPNAKGLSTAESIRDNDTIERFRVNAMSSGGKTTCNEKAVNDGAETSWAIRSVMDEYDLVIVGRRHDPNSNFTSGLDEWHECDELGIIGDLIASSDCNTDSLLLVVQKQDV